MAIGRALWLWMACSTRALIGAKPVPPATMIIGLVDSSRRRKVPQRSFEAQDVLDLHGREDLLGKGATRNEADVQLEQLVLVRRVGQREGAPLAVGKQKLDVLAGEELQALVGWAA